MSSYLGWLSMAHEVSNNLSEFISKDLGNYLKQAMAEACSVVQAAAREKAPSDTGNLRRSIDFEVEDDGSEGCVFSNAEYAPYVEVGTGIYSSKGNGRKTPWRYEGSHGWVTTEGNEAQPFLEPAAREKQSEIVKSFEGLF